MSFRFNKFGLIILIVVLAVLISGLVSAPAQAAMPEFDLPGPSIAPASPLATTRSLTSYLPLIRKN